jgi:hypothetical protein
LGVELYLKKGFQDIKEKSEDAIPRTATIMTKTEGTQRQWSTKYNTNN